MQISAESVKKLRDMTGMQMMKCKAALVETEGDLEKAVEVLRKQSKDAGAKFGDRPTSEGRIGAYIDPARGVGALVELLCESAPVAKNEMFVSLANDLAHQVAEKNPADTQELVAQPFVGAPGKSVADRIADVLGLMRENIRPARMARLQGVLGSYIHHDGTVGVLLQCAGAAGQEQVLKDVCMHIAARNPAAAVRDQVSKDVLEKEREIARSQAAEQGKGKPAEIVEKIAEGKLKTWLAENVLADQPFVKDESKTVGQILQAAGLELVSFVRYRVGTGG